MKTMLRYIFLLVLCLALYDAHRDDSSKEDSSYETGMNYWNTRYYCQQGDNATISCPAGKIIVVKWAFYGAKLRRGRICQDRTAKDKVEDKCNGKNTCEIECNDDMFNNTTCDDNKDEKLLVYYQCRPDPCCSFCCYNGGTCHVTSDLQPMCQCLGGWNGTQCEESPCSNTDCLNNGTCLINTNDGTAQCLCKTGYTGDRCQTQVDACSVTNCENNGSCALNTDGFAECKCADGFTGAKCEVDCSQQPPCPDGFETISTGSNNCFYFSNDTSESWLAARETCLGLGAALWEPNTGAEADAVAANLIGTEKYWTGAFDGVQEGTTKFIESGMPFPLTATGNTQTLDCVEYVRTSASPDVWEFQYRTCTVSTRRFVCETKSPCSALTPLIPVFQTSP